MKIISDYEFNVWTLQIEENKKLGSLRIVNTIYSFLNFVITLYLVIAETGFNWVLSDDTQ